MSDRKLIERQELLDGDSGFDLKEIRSLMENKIDPLLFTYKGELYLSFFTYETNEERDDRLIYELFVMTERS